MEGLNNSPASDAGTAAPAQGQTGGQAQGQNNHQAAAQQRNSQDTSDGGNTLLGAADGEGGGALLGDPADAGGSASGSNSGSGSGSGSNSGAGQKGPGKDKAAGQRSDAMSGESPEDRANRTEQADQPAEGLYPLPDDADDSQREAFDRKVRALVGVPDDPSGYGDFGYGEAVNRSTEEYRHYTETFHEAGLSPRQARMLLDKHIEWSRGQAEHIERQQKEIVSGYRNKVRSDFIKSMGGQERFKVFSDTAQRGFKASAQGAGLSGEETAALLNIMGDDPRFLKIFNHVGSLHREDVLITGARARAAEESMDDIISRQFNKGA